uniref:Uncharacterized protein n=1 Tax=Candidatus Kentrum eta TaxID=2126337 RepID=A0A450UV06_9GAMM|nr:MAG: hypothetical protein BECKH772A_GA0070896_1000622 [Candidatus Kentron sp. H]VFJ89985.1 MAG: hypothetical protein BECKH772B_GA0070898_1000722 [Candidatus Kentron sp. H]VFJ96367.1 MAG: hypothetical protein BECKH772C_GA0070978_1000622 [Candidatus Kentron sp. H]
MKRRRRESQFSSDSFLDIVSNVVGVLVLITIVVVINAQGIQISLGTPALQDPPRGAERFIFECQNSRVVPLDAQAAHEELIALTKEKSPVTAIAIALGKADSDDIASFLEENDIGGKYYRMTMEDGLLGDSVTVFTLRDASLGEDERALAREGSVFLTKLKEKGFDPKERWLYFIVRPDSFQVFRAARKIAREQGFSVGWNPIGNDAKLQFASGGGMGSKVQ